MRSTVLAMARKYLGVIEAGGPNRGAAIDRFLANAGTSPGQPWCAAFVYTVMRDAGYKPDVRYPASCRSWVAWAVENKAIISKPQPGDIVVFDWDGDGPDDHIGFCERLVSFGPLITLQTIEGNTPGVGGKRDGVYRRKRVMRRNRLVFIDSTG